MSRARCPDPSALQSTIADRTAAAEGARAPASRRGHLLGAAFVVTHVLGGILVGLAATAGAESQLQLPQLVGPPEVSATTYDPAGRAVGRSRFEIEHLAEGLRRLTVDMGIESGGRNRSEVTLAPVSAGPPGTGGATGERLRILEERSQSTAADGRRLDLLVVDHVAGRASCIPPDGGPAEARHVELPDRDRVVNVPMQLLFQPLVSGAVDEVRFQIVLCTGGPRLQNMIAVRGPRFTREGREVQEIRYGPDLGKTVAFFASRLLPSLSFWFDARDGSYLGHRMPLHGNGPEVVLVRAGLSLQDLGIE